jgi:hypothetical protein
VMIGSRLVRTGRLREEWGAHDPVGTERAR